MAIDVIILAGGLGTRLMSVVTDLPKPMAPVAGRPFLAYLFDYLIAQKMAARFILSVGYQYQKIVEHFGDAYQSYPLQYSVESTPLGTGGGIQLALQQARSEQVLILNGDTLFTVNLFSLLDFHREKQAELTLALKPLENFDRYHNILQDESGKVLLFEEKQFQKKGLINGGIYLINRNLLARFTLPEKFSFEEDFLKLYLEKLALYGLISTAYFIDIGIPEDYQKSQIQLPALFHSSGQVHPPD